MNPTTEINEYIASLPQAKRQDMQALHERMLQLLPNCPLWFLDGKDEEGKTVSNPNIGYGTHQIRYADGSSKPFYQVGISANTTGISVYIMGIKDKTYLKEHFGAQLGKATVTGYCIKFKALRDIDLAVLEAALWYGFMRNS